MCYKKEKRGHSFGASPHFNVLGLFQQDFCISTLPFIFFITDYYKILMTCRLKFANEAVEHLRREIIELASYFSGSNAQNEKVSSDWLIISKINKRKFLVANLNVFWQRQQILFWQKEYDLYIEMLLSWYVPLYHDVYIYGTKLPFHSVHWGAHDRKSSWRVQWFFASDVLGLRMQVRLGMSSIFL